jgi:aminoglycoside phosphotransferase (APT) family kinase protein
MDWEGLSLEPLEGGFSGETFVARGDEDLVVRIYRDNPDRAPIDAAVLRLVRGLVPAPEVVELRPAVGTGPAILVTEYLPSISLQDVLDDPPDDLDWEDLGLNLGWMLGALSWIPFLRHGAFVDADLAVSGERWPSDLAEWAQRARDTGRIATWSDVDWAGLRNLVDLAGDVLDRAGPYDDRAVLVHSDFNPKNIRMNAETLDIVGVVDWEFAHAGSIHTDFGNFNRFERDERLVGPFLEGFVDSAPGHIRDPVTRGRATDLWALIELAARPQSNTVTQLAERLLLAQARAGNLSAWPFDGERVSVRAVWAARTPGESLRIGPERPKPVS